jgi:hypothetical protein
MPEAIQPQQGNGRGGEIGTHFQQVQQQAGNGRTIGQCHGWARNRWAPGSSSSKDRLSAPAHGHGNHWPQSARPPAASTTPRRTTPQQPAGKQAVRQETVQRNLTQGLPGP